MSARDDVDKLHRWVIERLHPVPRVLLYVFSGSSLGICLIFGLLGTSGYRIFGIVNGVVVGVAVIDHVAYWRRRWARD